jgi:CBS domain-containing protein
MYEEQKRSIIKSISFRILATSTGMLTILIMTGETTIAASFAFLDVVTKLAIYYVHERLWNQIKFGKRVGLVSSAMRAPPVWILGTEYVSSLVDIMTKTNIGAVIVMEDDEAVGIVTERDVMNRVYKARKDPFTVMVKDIMSSPLEAIEFNDSLTEALQRMREKDIRRLAVVRSNQLVGIITHRRVLEALMHLENS